MDNQNLQANIKPPELMEISDHLKDEMKIDECRYYLNSTDYIIIKIAEAEAMGEHTEAERIRTEYADTIAQRAKTRKQINIVQDKWKRTL